MPAHYNTFVQVVNELDPHDAQSIEDCQEVFGSPTLKADLQFIADHFSFLPALMHQMEESDVGLVRGLSLFEEAEEKISQVPGPKGDILREKFAAVKQRNPDLQKMKDIRDQIVATRYQPDMRDHRTLEHVPLHTGDIERTFLHYKNTFDDKRMNWSKETIQKMMITQCYYWSSDPEPLVWE